MEMFHTAIWLIIHVHVCSSKLKLFIRCTGISAFVFLFLILNFLEEFKQVILLLRHGSTLCKLEMSKLIVLNHLSPSLLKHVAFISPLLPSFWIKKKEFYKNSVKKALQVSLYSKDRLGILCLSVILWQIWNSEITATFVLTNVLTLQVSMVPHCTDFDQKNISSEVFYALFGKENDFALTDLVKAIQCFR